MVKDEYINYVRRFVEDIDKDFPYEEFDLADKFLLGQQTTMG